MSVSPRQRRPGASVAKATAALVLLAGCTAAPNAPPAGTRFDGVYSGANTLVGGSGYLCGLPSYPLSVSVENGRFTYAYFVTLAGPPAVPVQIRADGALSGQTLYLTESYYWRGPDWISAWITVDGSIVGPALDAIVRDNRCVRHLTLRRN